MSKNGKCLAWCKKHLKVVIASAIALAILIVLLALIPTFILASVNGTYYSCVDGQIQGEGYIKLSTGNWTDGKQSGKYKVKGKQITLTIDGSDGAQTMTGTVQNKALVIGEEENAAYYRTKRHRHKLSDWKTTIAATCWQEGLEVKTCACGLEKERVKPMIEHITEKGFCVSCGRSQLKYEKETGKGYTVEGFAEGFENSKSVEIPSVYKERPVVRIGNYAFRYKNQLTSVIIPESVTIIKTSAFDGCGSLRKVNIPDSVTRIESLAFQNCVSLNSVSLGNGVVTIETAVFQYCSSLTSVELSSSVTEIGAGAFHACTSLKTITLPESVTSIGTYAFQSCSSLKSIVISASVKKIGSSAFYNCSSLTIYCEMPAVPSGWDYDWNDGNCPVVWGYTKSISE